MTENISNKPITLQYNNCLFELKIELSESLPMDELIEHIRTFLIGIGYHPETVADYIPYT